MKSLIARIRAEPALLLGLVQAVVALIVAFGLSLTAEQIGAILAVTAAVLSIVTRQLVTPSKPSAGSGVALLVLLALALPGCIGAQAKQACGPTVTLSAAALLEACTLAYQRAPDEQTIHELDLVCLPLGGIGEALERPGALAHLCGDG